MSGGTRGGAGAARGAETDRAEPPPATREAGTPARSRARELGLRAAGAGDKARSPAAETYRETLAPGGGLALRPQPGGRGRRSRGGGGAETRGQGASTGQGAQGKRPPAPRRAAGAGLGGALGPGWKEGPGGRRDTGHEGPRRPSGWGQRCGAWRQKEASELGRPRGQGRGAAGWPPQGQGRGLPSGGSRRPQLRGGGEPGGGAGPGPRGRCSPGAWLLAPGSSSRASVSSGLSLEPGAWRSVHNQ